MKLKTICALLSGLLLLAPGTRAENYKWDSIAMGGGGYVTGVVPAKSERGVFYARTDVGGAYRWDAGNERWVQLLDWVSEDQLGLLGVLSVAVDPRNAANVYLMAGTSYFSNGNSAILRSVDYGQTFTTVDVTAQFKVHGNAYGRQNGERLQVDPSNSQVLYVGTQQNGLFRSTDSGATWSRLWSLGVTNTSNGNGISFVLLEPATAANGGAHRIVVGVSRATWDGANLYVSGDDGATFQAVQGGPAGLMPQRAVISPAGKLYLTYANGAGPNPTKANDYKDFTTGQIWEYDLATAKWTDVTPAGIGGPFGGISIDPNDPKHLVASTSGAWMAQGATWGDHVFTTRDAGRSWVDVVQRGFAVDPNGIDWSKDLAIHWAGDIEFDPFDTKSAWVISGNGVYRTADLDAATTTWAFDAKGIEETVPYSVLSVPNWGPTLTSIGDFDGFLQWDLTKYGSRHTPAMGTTSSLVGSADGKVMARVGSSLYYSTDTGSSWTKSAQPKATGGTLALSADGKVLLHSPSDKNDNTHTYRSSDYGNNWVLVDSVKVENALPVADPVNPRKFYVYDNVNGRMLVSYDGAWTFWNAGTLAKGGFKRIAATPGVEGDLWLCLGDNGLVHSTDSGSTFTKSGAVGSCKAVGTGSAPWGGNYPTVYISGTVGGVRGVMRSTDKGNTWVRVNDDDHQYGGPGNATLIAGDANVFGRVYMSTAGRGMVYGDTSDGGDVVVTPAGGSAATVNKCDYVVTNSWQGGYNGEIRITNNRTSAVNGWSVNWTYGDASVVHSSWNAAVSGTAPKYTATANQSWNTNIAPGATVSFGLSVTGAAIPTVTGDVCK
ncbi:MAG TPA: cellulose binding domain-containing protein [Duganella sp.]|nr:cellulose binding domain-containing protein [Duganella sp.]